MKKISLKSFELKNRTTKIIMDNHDDSQATKNELIALSILLGAYNENGRGINVDTYQQIKSRFDECINEIKELL